MSHATEDASMQANANGVGSGRLVLLDDDKQPTREGDTVFFTYGIPPVGVRAKIVRRGNSLIALTLGHKPRECNLRALRKYVGSWYKQNEKLSNSGTGETKA